MQIMGFMLGPRWFVRGPRSFLDTNLLVSVMQNVHVGGLEQREDPTYMGSRSGGIQA